MKTTLGKVALIIVLVLIAPVLVGNITARVLEYASPPPSSPLIESLAHTRAITRITLGVVGLYYVVLAIAWLLLRRRRIAPAAT